MKSRTKSILIISSVILIIASLTIITRLLSRTLYSPEGMVGNTAGNLYNDGLFCEYDGKIYFSNANDNGTLYSMNSDCSDIEKLNDDRIYFINADDNYIYYSRRNNELPKDQQSVFTMFNTGLYRIRHNGDNTTKIFGDPTGTVLVYDNNIYCQHYNDETGVHIYRTDIAGSDHLSITDEFIVPVSVYNNNIYYTGVSSDHGIHALNLTTLQDTLVLDDHTYMPIATENGIYYIATTENYNICRINYDGTGKTVLVEEFCSSYNLSPDGQYLFFQVDGGDSNRICVLELATGNVETILSGDFNELNVTSNYLFFSAFNGNTVYAYSLDGSRQLNIFNPTVGR